VINDALRTATGCLRPTLADNLPLLAGIQPADLRGKRASLLCFAHRTMEPAHLIHPALTESLGGNARQLKSRHPFLPAAQLTVHLTTTYVRRTGRITNEMRSGWTTLGDSILSSPTSAPTLPGWLCQEQRGSDLTTSAPLSDASAPVCTNRVCPPLRLVSLAQKNEPSTMLFSNVQSIDLLVDCTS